MASDIHGTYRGVYFHTSRGEKLCPFCATVDTDRQRAHRISTGKARTIHVTVDAIVRILAGEDADAVLAEENGPQSMTAFRRLAGERRG